MTSKSGESNWFDQLGIEDEPELRKVLSRFHGVSLHAQIPPDGIRRENTLADAVERAPQAVIAMCRSHADVEFHSYEIVPEEHGVVDDLGRQRFTNFVTLHNRAKNEPRG